MLQEMAYRRWLESLPPEQIAGWACDDQSCPLALYLRSQGVGVLEVGPVSYVMLTGGGG